MMTTKVRSEEGFDNIAAELQADFGPQNTDVVSSGGKQRGRGSQSGSHTVCDMVLTVPVLEERRDVFGSFTSRVLRRSSFQPDNERCRQLLIVGAASLTVSVAALSALDTQKEVSFHIGACLVAALVSLLVICVSLFSRNVGDTAVTFQLGAYELCVVAADLHSGMVSEARYWPLFILILNAAVTLQVPSKTQCVLMAVSILWIAATAMESLLRYGLFDDWYLPYDERPLGGCSKPPCTVGTGQALRTFLIQAAVLLGNHILVSRLAHKVQASEQREAATMRSAVVVAEDLSRMNLKGAESVLVGSMHGLPDELGAVYFDLLKLLQETKPIFSLGEYSLANPDLGIIEANSSNSPLSSRTSSAASWDATPNAPNLTPQSTDLVPVSRETGTCKFGESTRSVNPLLSRPSYRKQAPSSGDKPCRASMLESQHGSSRKVDVELAKPKRSKITLALFNMQESCQMMEEGTFEPSLSRTLHNIIAHVTVHKGLVDNFIGDHITTSFNAVRPCARHALGAITSAKGVLVDFPKGIAAVNCSVGTGVAYSADIGSASMRRYAVYGRLPLIVSRMERQGREWDIALVLNGAAYTDAMTDYEMKLIVRNVGLRRRGARCVQAQPTTQTRTRRDKSSIDELNLSKRSEPSAPSRPCEVDGVTATGMYYLYELVFPSEGAEQLSTKDKVDGSEWMYTLKGSSRERYNEAVEMFLKGRPLDTIRSHVSGEGNQRVLAEIQTIIEGPEAEQVFLDI